MPTRILPTLGAHFPPAYHRPFLRYIEGDQGGGGDLGFPANTPVKDMTAEQQAAYNLHQSRRWENRAKSFGDWTPEKIQALQDENQTLKTSHQTDADKAVDAAREEGRNEIRAELNRERATTALEKALAGRVPDAGALLGLDVTKFITEGKVDTAAVKAWVDDNSEPTTAQRRNPDMGQGRRDQVHETAGDRGRAEGARRFNKNNDSQKGTS